MSSNATRSLVASNKVKLHPGLEKILSEISCILTIALSAMEFAESILCGFRLLVYNGMVMSPLTLSFGMMRPLCHMQLGSPCQVAEVEFRVMAAEVSPRDLVQEFLANRVFSTSSGWGMPKKKDVSKKHELVRLPYWFKFDKEFKKPCQEWLEMIETMCNEILGNYTKKEDQLMTAAFGTRPK
jgi:hypothetical protein